MTSPVTVTTQAELDQALADKAETIYVHSKAGVWLRIGDTSDSRVVLRGSSRAVLSDSSRAELWDSSRAELRGSSHAELSDSSRAVLHGSSRAVLRGSSRAELWGSSHAVLSDSSYAELRGSSYAVLRGSSRAELWGSSHAVLSDSSRAELRGSSYAVLRGSSRAVLWGSSHAVLSDSSRAELRGSSHAELWGSSHAVLSDSSRAVLHGSSRAVLSDSSHAELHGSSHAITSKYAAVHLFSQRAMFDGQGHLIDLTGIDFNDPAQWCEYHGVTVKDGIAYLYKAVGDDWKSKHGAEYAPGSLPEAPDWKTTRECQGGLFFCDRPHLSASYFRGATRFVKVGVRLDEMVTLDDKVKAKRVVVPCVEVDRFGDVVEAAEVAQ